MAIKALMDYVQFASMERDLGVCRPVVTKVVEEAVGANCSIQSNPEVTPWYRQ